MPAAPRIRAPDATRERLLAAAFEVIHRQGFQGAGLDTILDRAGVTKGALYHHFEDKAALGRAVVDEVIRRPILEVYLGGLDTAPDPLTAIQDNLRGRANDFRRGGIELGCPLNNLAQEMSPVDEALRARIDEVLAAWRAGYVRALQRAARAGQLRDGVDVVAVAALIVASVEGAFGIAKAARSVGLLRMTLTTLADFLETLRSG